MKISLEAKIQGALAGVRADGTLMYTSGFNPSYAKFLQNLDDPDPVQHASFCMLKDPGAGKHLIMHWQTGFESFPGDGRYYCTRALYEASSSDIVDADLCSFVSNLPSLKHYASKEFDVAPFVISVNEAGSVETGQNSAFVKCLWSSIAAGKPVFIRLDNPQACSDNALLKDSRLLALMSAFNAMPAYVRKCFSLAFSFKAKDVSDKTFGNLWIVAYYPDESHPVDASDAIVFDWTGKSLVCETNLDEYEELAGELRSISPLLDDSVEFADWTKMREAVLNEKKRVDQALQNSDSAVLSKVYKKSDYRSQEVKQALMANITRQGLKTVEEVNFLNQVAKKDNSFDRFVVRMLQTETVSPDVKKELWRLFKDRTGVSSEMGAMKDKLSLVGRYENFTNEMFSLSYDDLSLDRVSDDEFISIYQNGLLAGKYKGVEVKKIPGSHAFPLRCVQINMKRSPRFIVSEKNRAFIKNHNIVGSSFVSWLFENNCVRDVDILINLAECMDKNLCREALERYLHVNAGKITCANLLMLRKSGKFAFTFQNELSDSRILLGDLKELCKGMSDKEKKDACDALRTRKPKDLQEWEMMMDVFGKCEFPIEDAYFEDAEKKGVDYESVLKVYRKYSDKNVRTYIENKIADAYAAKPKDDEILHAVKEICRLNKSFKARLFGTVRDRMLSKKGAALAWLLVFINFILVLILASLLLFGGEEQIAPEKHEVEQTESDSAGFAPDAHNEEMYSESETNKE